MTSSRTPGRPTLVAVAHGSRDPRALPVVRALLARVRAARPGLDVRLGHVELDEPLLSDTLAALRGPAVLVPLLLSRGHHVRHDLPAALASAPRVAGTVAAPLGPHPLLAEALHDRLREAGWPQPTAEPLPGRPDTSAPPPPPGPGPAGHGEHAAPGRAPAPAGVRGDREVPHGTDRAGGTDLAGGTDRMRDNGRGAGPGLAGRREAAAPDHAGDPAARTRAPRGAAVVLAAAGSRDPDGARDAGQAARMLAGRLGVPVVAAYASAAAPTVADAVDALVARGADRERIAVASYFTAPGRFATQCAAAGPWIAGEPLGAHPAMARLVLHRYDEALRGLAAGHPLARAS